MVKVTIQPHINHGGPSDTVDGKLDKYTRMLANEKESYEDHLHHFSEFLFYNERERIELAISYGFLEILLPLANHSTDRNLVFQILLSERAWKKVYVLEQLNVLPDGSLQTKEPDHRIPLKNEEAFRKYVQRAKKNGIIKTLVNKGRGKKLPQRSLWTDVLKYLVILYATCKPTKTSSKEISRDIENLISDYPDVIKKGVSPVSPSAIRAFIREEGGTALISFAKDNKNDFKRKILGVLRFLPPSAPLVQVGVDGYHFQVVCADDETEKPIQLVAIVIYDFKTKAVLGLAFGKSENNVVYRKAWQDFFKTTGNKLPRQIVMDRFSAYTCEKVRNLNLLLNANGVHFTKTSQPNNNGRLERFFGVIQNFYQGSVLSCSYVGSSITSKSDNARPNKQVQVNIRKKMFLKGESEMIHLLTYILKEEYNKKFDAINGKSPMDLFTTEESDHIAKITDSEVAFATFEGHRCTIAGSGVIIRKEKQLYLFKKRSLKVATKFFRKQVDVYIDPNAPKGGAYIFQMGVRRFHFLMPHLSIVPSALYDRTESDKDFIRCYNKETRELLAAFQALFKHMDDTIDKELNGIDFKASREAAKIKKRADGAFLQTQLGLTATKPEPPQAYANSLSKIPKSKRVGRVTAEQNLINKYGL